MSKLSKSMRIVFLTIGLIIWFGMYLTGLDNIHWFLYIPVIILLVAGISGMCVMNILLKKILK